MSPGLVDDGGDLFFGVDARHIRQLGRQLVGDRITALSELIKNSYDADASFVRLEFSEAHGDGTGKIVLEDDGSGMDLDTLRSSWMRISGDEKERNPVSPVFSRPRAGRKGIGRFSVETLGQHLTLVTTRSGLLEAIHAEFDWEHAYRSGADLMLVPNPWRRVQVSEELHGTRLIIDGLHDAWTQAQRDRVSRSILLLQPPFPIADTTVEGADPGFRVQMLVDGIEQSTAGGLDEFLAGATARIEGGVDDDGQVWMRVRSSRLDLDESKILELPSSTCGSFKLDAAYFVYVANAIGVPVRSAQEMAKRYGGMRVYRDGLRLLPYGEQNDDWLGLNELYRSRSRTLSPVGRDNYFGQVTISRSQNPQLVDTASREGLVQNSAFAEMREIAFEVLVQGAIAVAATRKRSQPPRPPKPPSRRQVLQEATDSVAIAVRDALQSPQAESVVRLVEAALETTASDAVEADRAESIERVALLEELELLRILASLGTSINVFSHEVRSTVNANSTALAVLAQTVDSEELTEARDASAGLADLAGYIDSYSSASQRRTREPLALQAVLRSFRDRFANTLAAQVTTRIHVSPISLRTEPMGLTTLEAILINLFTNSVKAMDGEGHPKREVLVSATAEDRWVLLRVEDTGTGIPPGLASRIFDAFVTSSSTAESELGAGTGLGLKIVADLLEEYGGSIVLRAPSDGYTTAFEVRLPRLAAQVRGSADE